MHQHVSKALWFLAAVTLACGNGAGFGTVPPSSPFPPPPPPPGGPPPAGPATLVLIPAFHSTITQINVDRKVRVYLPPGYGTDLQRRYPVLYVNGSDLTAGINYATPATGLIQQGAIEPLIMVGVFIDPTMVEGIPSNGVPAVNYQRMIMEELVPYIDATYRTKATAANRAVAGVSQGGNASWKLALHNPGIFGKLAAFSPALNADMVVGGVTGNNTEREYINSLPSELPVKIMWGRGTTESPIQHAEDARMIPALEAKGWTTPAEYLYYDAPVGGLHDNPSISTRVAPMLRYLFPPS